MAILLVVLNVVSPIENGKSLMLLVRLRIMIPILLSDMLEWLIGNTYKLKDVYSVSKM